MIYKVTIAGYAICRHDMMRTLPHIPDTEQEKVFDTDSLEYKLIWDGYIELRESQKSKPVHDDEWSKVRVSEDGEHIDQFREALNLFMRFLAGEGRDNCNQVKSIELVTV